MKGANGEPTWPDVESLFSDLRNDRYEVVEIRSSRSDPARSKSVTIVVERDG